MSNFAFRLDFTAASEIPGVADLRDIMRAVAKADGVSSVTLVDAATMREDSRTAAMVKDESPALYFKIAGDRDQPFTAARDLIVATGAMPTGLPQGFTRLSS